MSSDSTTKAIIMVGGETRGTRFRPLSLDIPKMLFPIAGKPLMSHIIDSLLKVDSITEIILIGFYEASTFSDYIADFNHRMRLNKDRPKKVTMKYLKEFKALGTAGGLYHFKGDILKGNPDNFYVIHGDIVCSYPFVEMYDYYIKMKNSSLVENRNKIDCLMFGVKITDYELFVASNLSNFGSANGQSAYGTIVTDNTSKIVHYVEKPESKISDIINGGIYLFNESLFRRLSDAKISKITISNDMAYPESLDEDVLSMEKDILHKLPDLGNSYVYEYKGFWKQIKTPADALFANELYLDKLYQSSKTKVSNQEGALSSDLNNLSLLDTNIFDDNGDPLYLQKPSASIIPPVYIHSSAKIGENCKIGPYVTIGENVVVERGVRLSNCIVLNGSTIANDSIVLNSIISKDCKIGSWCHIQGTGVNLSTVQELIRKNGTKKLKNALMSSGLTSETQVIGIKDSGNITILGSATVIDEDCFILNSFILPSKSIKHDVKYEIVM